MNTIEKIQFNRIARDVLVAGILQSILLCKDYVALLYRQDEKRTGRCEISYELYEQLPELVPEYAAITAGVPVEVKQPPRVLKKPPVSKLEQQLAKYSLPTVDMPPVDLLPLPYQKELDQWAALRHKVTKMGLLFVQTKAGYITFRDDAIRTALLLEHQVAQEYIENTLDAYLFVQDAAIVATRIELLEIRRVVEVGISEHDSDAVALFQRSMPSAYKIPDDNPVIDLTATITQYEQTGKMQLVEPEKPIVEWNKQQSGKPAYAGVWVGDVSKHYHGVHDIPTVAVAPQFPEWYAHRTHNGFSDPNGPLWVPSGDLQSSLVDGTLIDWLLRYEKRDGVHLAAHNTEGGGFKSMGLAGMYHTLLAYFLGKLIGGYMLTNDAGERDESALHDFVGGFAGKNVSFDELTNLGLHYRRDCLHTETVERGELLERLAARIQRFQESSSKFTADQKKRYENAISSLQDVTLDPTLPAGYAFWRALLKGKLLLTRSESQLLRFCLERY